MRVPHAATLSILLAAGALAASATGGPAPPRPAGTSLLTVTEVSAALEDAARRDWIQVTTLGRSAGGRPIHAVRIRPLRPAALSWRLLLIGQQHGDEPAGKEALVQLLSDLAEDPALLPAGVELWMVPQANPDGAAAGRRRNDAGADLNRDHLLLDQPETRALHRLARLVRPHVVVDCHEFDRTSTDYLDRGWLEWPLATMDSANSLLLPEAVYDAGLTWVEAAEEPMREAGIRYQRYLVGGAPPEGELRPSTLEADDARNGLALLGSLGFIIETGRRRADPDPEADLTTRVGAVRLLLDRFLGDRDLRAASLGAVAETRAASPPAFLPVNALWGSTEPRPSSLPVVDRDSGAVLHVITPNLMLDRVLKHSVAAPVAWVVPPGHVETHLQLVTRHGLEHRVLATRAEAVVQPCRLDRVEEHFDPLHKRYAGRQVVSCAPPMEVTVPAGSLVVPLDQPDWRVAAALLEPQQVFGLYQWPRMAATVASDGILPVRRVLQWRGEP